MTLSSQERALLLEALARQAAHVRACIDACESGTYPAGWPADALAIVRAQHREDLAALDRLFAKFQAGGLS